MFRTILIAGLLAAVSAPATAAQRAAYSTADTTIGTLLDDPAARAVLERYIPDISSNSIYDLARNMTLRQIQGFNPEQLNDIVLIRIDFYLEQIPARK